METPSSQSSFLSGPILSPLIRFALPLMLSLLLQAFYGGVDLAVVGKFSSAEALGAVGSTTILVSLFTGFLIGMGSAVNVRVAQHLGAREKARTSATIRTSFIICLATGCIITVLCLLSARFMLELLGTKEDLIEGAVLYFRIYALGMPALGIFNFGNGVLSANGDTKRPLVYLMIAGLLNVMFNLFFVIVCDMAEDGVALASIITQYVSAVLILIHMGRQTNDCAFRLRDLKDGIDRTEGKRVLGLGIPAGLQNAVFAVANLFIQGAVNSFESVMVEGNSAAANADAEQIAKTLDAGLPTVTDILAALARPGRDPREDTPPPLTRKHVAKLSDLAIGSIVKGRVQNVVDFGAFIDIGLKTSGFAHRSELSDKRFRHPLDVVAVGDIVEAEIISIDEARNRIGLSLKRAAARKQ